MKIQVKHGKMSISLDVGVRGPRHAESRLRARLRRLLSWCELAPISGPRYAEEIQGEWIVDAEGNGGSMERLPAKEEIEKFFNEGTLPEGAK